MGGHAFRRQNKKEKTEAAAQSEDRAKTKNAKRAARMNGKTKPRKTS